MSYKSSFFRGGGCGASKSNMPKYQQQQISIPMATMEQIKIQIQKIKDSTNPEYLLGHIQFFLINERYLQYLTENIQACQAHYPYILDRLYDLLNAIIFNLKLRTKLSYQCAYHLTEITTKLMKMVFVFCANDDKLNPVRMPIDKYNTYLSLITQIKVLISSEETDKFYKNSLWYEYQIIYIIWNMIPNDAQPNIKDVVIKIVSHSITSFSTGIINPALFAAIQDGIKLLYKAQRDDAAKIKFQIIYSLELIRWRLVEQIERNDPFNISKQTILDVYQYVKDSDDWMIMFCWIKNLGAIFNHLPTIKQNQMTDSDLIKFVKKKYLFRISPELYQINLNYEQLQSDPDALHLMSHMESFQNLAQMQSFILQGNDIMPSFENYYLTTDTKPDETKDTLTIQERSYNDLRLSQMKEFISEIQKEITDFQNEVELTILQGNRKDKKNCDFSKIQPSFHQLFDKIFSLNLFQGQMEFIERLWKITEPEYFGKIQQNKCEANSIEIKAFKCVAEQELKSKKLAQMMNDAKGQSQNMDAEFIEIFKSQKIQNSNKFQLSQFQFFAEEWIVLQNDPTLDNIAAILKKVKNQKKIKLNFKNIKTLEQHIQIFNNIFYQYNCVNQLHKNNLNTLLMLRCLIQQQLYQKEYYQTTSKHNKLIQIQILCLSKQLLGYDYFTGILAELSKLSHTLEGHTKELQKLNTQLSIDHQLPILTLRQIISKDQNLTHYKIVQLLQYFIQQQKAIEQIIIDQSAEDMNSYFDILCAIQQNIFETINQHKNIYKQSKEYFNILQNAKLQSDDDQISESHQNLKNVFRDLIIQYQEVQINKLTSAKKVFQICQNRIQMYFEQNQSIFEDSIQAQMENLLKIQQLNQVILDLNLEDSTQNKGALHIFKQIDHLIKFDYDKKPEQVVQSQESPPVSPGPSPLNKLKMHQFKSLPQLPNFQGNQLLELYHQKFMDLEVLTLQVQDSLVQMKKKNSNYLKIMQALNTDLSQAIKQERSFSVEMKHLRKISLFQIEQIDDSFYDDYRDYMISASQEQNIKFLSHQIQNTVLNIFVDRPQSKFQIYKQKALDFVQNSPWRFRHQAAWLLQQMKDKCLHKQINDCCLKVLTRFYAYESDQRVRYVLENQQSIIQILSQHWPSQEEQIQEYIKENLKDLNNLGFELQQVIDIDQRKIIQFKIQEKKKDIEEIIKNVTNVGSALGIQILFIQDLKQDLFRIEGKINEISDSLNQISADIRYLRGKTVSQLLEIRMNRILQNKLIFDSRSVYVQLKTKEKKINSKSTEEENETNLYTNDIFGDGEVNEFLWKQKKDSMLIHGQAGSGKSTAARKIEEFLWMFYKQNKSITEQIPLIPIMINLPSLKNPKYQAVEEVLKSDSYRFDNKQILEFKEAVELGKYRIVIILDSYDEMSQSLIGINLNFTNKLQKWRQHTDMDKYPKIITTTRTEIFNTNDYYTWFLSESNNAQNNFKEVRLLKFTNGQVYDYLQQFTKLNVKKTLFEYYQQLITNGNEIDQLERFEQLWAQIQIVDDKQQLLSERDISQIIQLLKQDKNIQMFTNEIERSLNSELKQLWPTSVYLTCIQTMHLYELLETPFMMEIVVQVLPIIVKRKSEPDQIEPTFIKHFVELKLLEINQEDARKMAETVWETLKQNSNFFNHFQITKSSRILLYELNKEFPQFQESNDSALIVQALLSQDLVQYDYYDFFFEMYFERQIRKLQDNGQAYDYFSLQREIRQFATELAIRMTNEEKTQIEYQSNGLLYKQAVQDNWTDHYFDDSDGKEGQFRKLYRSCIPMKQRNSFYSFNHKSLQEFLVAKDFCMFIANGQNEKIETHNVNLKYWFSEFMIGTCHFIVDKLKKDRVSKNKMIEIVKQTALNGNIVTGGSNCLFLLSKMGEFLGNQNFEGINIKNIDLTGSNFYNSTLASSRFENVNISNSNFNYCNLDSVKWLNIKINQLPNLKIMKQAIKQIAFVTDEKDTKLIAIDESLNILRFDIKAGKEMAIPLQNKKALMKFININQYYLVLVLKSTEKPDFLLEVLDLESYQWISQYPIEFNITQIEFISQTEILIRNGHLYKKLNIKTKKIEDMDYLTQGKSFQAFCTNIRKHLIAFLQKIELQPLMITIFDINQNKQLIITKKNEWKGMIALSPSGTLLALGVDTEVSLWQAQQMIGTIKLENFVNRFIFSHDETRLMTLSNQSKSIQIWNLNSKQQIGPIYNHDDQVNAMGLSDDNILIASGLQNGTIKCWDTSSSELEQIHKDQQKQINNVLFSRDTQLLLISSKKSIEVWRLLNKMSLIKELKGFRNRLTCMAMSQNQNIVCAGNKEAHIFVWSLSDGELKHVIPTHQSYPLDLKMIDDNLIISIEINNIIKFINLQESCIKFINNSDSFDLYDNIQSYKNAFNVPQPEETSFRCPDYIQYFIVQNRHLIQCENGKFEIQFNFFLSKEYDQKIVTVPNLDIVKTLYKFGKNKKILAIIEDEQLAIYYYSKKRELKSTKKQLTYQQSKYNIIQFDTHNTTIFLANDKIYVFLIVDEKDDKTDKKQINLVTQLFKENTEPIITLTYSLNKEHIYGGCQNGYIYRWNFRAKKLIDSFKAPDQLNQLIYSSALLNLISISKNQVLLWNNLQQSEPLIKSDEQFQQFYYSEISSDKMILALAADKYILLIDIEHHEIIDKIQVPTPCEYFCYSSKKLCILARFGGQLKIYQLSVQKNIQKYIVDQKKQPLCLSVYKENIAIGRSNGSILFGTQQCMNEQFQHSTQRIICVHLSSEYLLSGNTNQIFIWKLDLVKQKELTDIPFDKISVKNLQFCKLSSIDQIMVIEQYTDPIVYIRQNEKFIKILLGNNSNNIDQNQKKYPIAIDTDGNSVIVLYEYLHLKRYIKSKDQSYSCSHTYGQTQNIECEQVKLNQAKIVSYLGLDLLKLFK